jgi:hypothetical protein
MPRTYAPRRAVERRSIELTPLQWQALEDLATMTGSVAPSGPTPGTASWRTLIKRIATGDLKLGHLATP